MRLGSLKKKEQAARILRKTLARQRDAFAL
jgi:hypothetical protein